MTSAMKRIRPGSRPVRPYSVRYTAAKTPSGTAMTVAQNVMTIVPTIAGYMPPPGFRLMIGRSSVRKLQSTIFRPFIST